MSYEKLIKQLLQPIKLTGMTQYASSACGHLIDEANKEVLPWWNLEFIFGGEIYKANFAKYETSTTDNNFYRDYRYFDLGILNKFLADNNIPLYKSEPKVTVRFN